MLLLGSDLISVLRQCSGGSIVRSISTAKSQQGGGGDNRLKGDEARRCDQATLLEVALGLVITLTNKAAKVLQEAGISQGRSLGHVPSTLGVFLAG